MPALSRRSWVPEHCETLVQRIAGECASMDSSSAARRLEALAARNREIHDEECFNLNPAGNVMNPRAEALLSSGLSARASLGWPGEKYETGLEAIEEIEVMAAELSAEVFGARFAEIRVPSGALANLYAFMATCEPGDAIIAPPAQIAGHVTHHGAGAAGLYGLKTYDAPVLADGYTVDAVALRALALKVRPKLITIGGSLNLFAHPVRALKEIAGEAGARLLFDAAHLSGMIAGGVWPDPLAEGADLMTMSAYKSLGGPAGGIVVTNDEALAKRLDAIAFPGLTANFDAGKAAALAITLLDWREYGQAYAGDMARAARWFAEALDALGIPVFAKARGFTSSHQFAVEAAVFGGGQRAAKRLRAAGLLACGIGLPGEEVDGDLNGLRLGVPEIVRRGVRTKKDIEALAGLTARALRAENPAELAAETARMRARFRDVHYVMDA